MKKQKIWVSRIVVGVMLLISLLGNSNPFYSYATENDVVEENTQMKDEVNYVALGDSITAKFEGYTSYVDSVSEYIGENSGKCNTANLAVDGWRSDDLLEALTNPTNSRYQTYRTAISQADIITMDIGSNDITIAAMQVVAEKLDCSVEQIGDVVYSWIERIENASGFAKLWLQMEAYVLISSLRNELMNGNALKEAIEQFESNYVQIVVELEKLAPNADIYIGDLYNPYVGVEPVKVSGMTVIDLDTFARNNISKANAIIARESGDNVVVDLYNTINDVRYIKGTMQNWDYDPHPNAEGKAAIASKFIEAIAANN